MSEFVCECGNGVDVFLTLDDHISIEFAEPSDLLLLSKQTAEAMIRRLIGLVGEPEVDDD